MRSRRDHGSIYLVTVLVCALVTTLAAAALALARRQAQQATLYADSAIADSLTRSAVAASLHWAAGDPAWRQNAPNAIVGGTVTRVWDQWHTLRDGRIHALPSAWIGGSLQDSEIDPFLITITAERGPVRRRTSVVIDPRIQPLPVLQHGLYAAVSLEVKSGNHLTGNGVNIRCGGNARIDGVIHADLLTSTRSGGGTINGTISTGAPTLSLPDAAALDRLIARATRINNAGDIDKKLISPAVNTYGSRALNPLGLYYIHSVGDDITIKESRISGTLVVNVGTGKKVVIDGSVLMESLRADLPALIVIGNCELNLRSATETLNESSHKVNFNPAGAPYEGVEDADTTDTYPAIIRGLVYVTGNLTIKESPRVEGPVICGGSVLVDGRCEILSPPTATPPAPFYAITGHVIREGTWMRLP
ncbi:MAG TPA: hypothetical protein PKB10_00070 [Tepidisphaeraceae bacterium]|nr:hypothetical protein [Tepidisphaeraceae bacterium]